MTLLHLLSQLKTRSIIANAQGDAPVVHHKLNFQTLRSGVMNDVICRFLGHTIDGLLCLFIQIGNVSWQLQRKLQPGAFGIRSLPFSP